MYSEWLCDLFQRRPCIVCNHTLTPDAMIAAGAERVSPVPSRPHPPWKGFLVVRCSNCHQKQKWILHMSPFELHLAVAAVRAKGTRQQDAKHARRSGRSDRFTGGAIDVPIEDDEVEAFMRRLRRTSFRPGSKTFQTWLRKMGVNPKMPP